MSLKSLSSVALFSTAFLLACSPERTTPSKAETLQWSQTTLAAVTQDTPSIDTLMIEAIIPRNFNFGRSATSFGEDGDYVYFPDQQNTQFLRNVGIVSSLADFCKMDFDNLNFLPMMQWQRKYLSPSERSGYKIYVIGVTHGYAMGKTDQWLEENPIDCEAFKDRFKEISFKATF